MTTLPPLVEPGAELKRAVGLANGQNRLAIVVPCHRVIGASGKLTGFAGGLEAKERLLTLEGGDWSQIGKTGDLF